MSITYQNLKDRLTPWLLVYLEKTRLDLLVDADFLRLFNHVARDLNLRSCARVERFYKKCNTTNAEDADLTNYLVQGVILKVFTLKYHADAYKSQYYSYIDDRLILKVAPSEGVQLDMWYLRDTEDIEELADEIDLPDQIIDDYEQLVKKKIMVDYGPETDMSYEQALEYYTAQAMRRLPRRYWGEVRNYWFDQATDQNLYEIRQNYIGLENFTAGADGNYTHVGGND